MGGNLYGTTSSGGKYGIGTIFTMSPAGKERVIYSFSFSDGSPETGLTRANGKLYGTTDGEVFTVTANGKLDVLHTFTYAEGIDPQAPLVVFDGALYGTATSGGAHGYGTLFAVTP